MVLGLWCWRINIQLICEEFKHMWKTLVIAGVLGTLLGVVAAQQYSIRLLLAETTAQRHQLSASPSPASEASEKIGSGRPAQIGDGNLRHRVSQLEQTVAGFAKISDHLMERGQIPLSNERLAGLVGKFADPGAKDSDRLQTLRQLRRSNGLTEEVAGVAAAWLSTLTNSGVQRAALEQLRGVSHPALREPFLQMAVSSPDGNVRERAVANLGRFLNDPQVENQLWASLQNDPDPEVREEAREAIVEGEMTESRITALKTRGMDPGISVDEQAVIWEALREAGHQAPELSARLAQLAQTTPDSAQRIKLFRAFDDHNDLAFVPSLIKGLEDPNPMVRERAADALSDYRTDQTVQQWLKHVAETDVDSAVRREAYRGLPQDR